jgi:phospholipid/cholesterol/gamma-HCH transport system substrate-binding protein
MERTRRRALETLLGLALAAALVLGVVLVWESFSGAFSDKITVSAQLARAGDALEQGDIVTYRNVIIGEVTGATGNTEGGAVARLKIDPGAAGRIPANVTAVAVPASLFGNTKIELLPATRPASARLHAGSVVAADRSPAAESLQTALANAYTLLTSVHPAELDAALSALATALQGQGPAINTLIHRADGFLRKLAPHLGGLNDVVTSLATVTDELARNAPDLLDSLANTLVVSRGVLRDKQALESLLAVAPAAVDNAQQLLSPSTVDNAVTVLQNEVPVTQAFADNPNALADTIAGFREFGRTFNQALASGPYLKANILLTGADFAQLINVGAGQKGNVFHAIVNPPQYTPADCPRYGGASGASCSGAAASASGARVFTTTHGQRYGGSSSSIGSVQELRAVTAAAATITGQPAGSVSGATADLLLGPLLRGTTTYVRGAP